MTHEQLLHNLRVPQHPVDVILDTDAYNEIDDQFAISYLLRSSDKLHTVGLVAAPFFNKLSTSPADGMERSYQEIKRILAFGQFDTSIPVLRGSERYLPDERTPVPSEGADFIVACARKYSPQNPLYIVAIGAITNVASALIQAPDIRENVVIVWLGGHGHEYHDTREFNMVQDIAASRVVMSCGAPFVQLPCFTVVSELRVSEAELDYWLVGKNPLATYLAEHTKEAANSYAKGRPWTRVIWDVSAVAYLLNDKNRFMSSRTMPTYLSSYEGQYEAQPIEQPMKYVYYIERDAIVADLFGKLTG